ncbi:MAG: AAA family ATPase, partial [Aureispira sp.]
IINCMLTKVTLQNFFSFGKATTIELNPGVNLLIGINASGKSNFLKALQLLKVGVVEQGLQELIKSWGGWERVGNYGAEKRDSTKLTYEFDFEEIGTFKYTISFGMITDIVSDYTFYILNEELLLKENSADNWLDVIDIKIDGNNYTITGKIRKEFGLSNEVFSYTESRVDTLELMLGQNNWYNPYIIGKLYNSIESMHNYHYFDTSSSSIIRQAKPSGSDRYLFSDGSNLNNVFHHIKNEDLEAYRLIKKEIKNINQRFEDLDMDIDNDGKHYLTFVEDKLRKPISIAHISDGTLYYLILMVVFYNSKRGEALSLDEPERGLHPDMIHSISRAIKHAAADGTQLFIATHSPLLLNDFEIEDVIIFEKDSDNQTCIKTAEDFEDANSDYLLGQLWLNGEIGGKRW